MRFSKASVVTFKSSLIIAPVVGNVQVKFGVFNTERDARDVTKVAAEATVPFDVLRARAKRGQPW
jgi:hypothetical protein